jgi:transposase
MRHVQDTQKFVSGKVVFCGMDIHKENWDICFMSDGLIVEQIHIQGKYARLLDHVRHLYSSASSIRFVYEAGFSGFWLYRRLTKDGYSCTVTPPSRIPKTPGKVKTDKIDAAKLAQYHAAGVLKHIYVPPESIESDRQVARKRLSFVKKKTSIMNEIKSFLLLHGLEKPTDIPTSWSKAYRAWLQKIEFESPSDRFVMDRMLSQYYHVRQELALLTKRLREMSRTEPYQISFKRLTACRGVGLITAMTFLLEVHVVTRFSNSSKFGSFLGMTPGQHSSGENVHLGSITHEGNHYLRRVLVESAWTVIRHDPHLRDKYNRIRAKGTNGKKAIVAVARSLAIRMRRCLLDGVSYEIGTC